MIRKARSENGPNRFTSGLIRAAIKRARPAMRAMILLGLNSGLGNTDVAELTAERFDRRVGPEYCEILRNLGSLCRLGCLTGGFAIT